MRAVPSTIAAKLTAAAELFSERGLDQTKMEDVAQATGIPKATLYYYFSGKEQILAYLLADGLMAIADAVAIALEVEGSAAFRLGCVIDAQLRVMNDYPAVARAVLSEQGRAARIPEIAAALDAAYYAPVAALLGDGLADGSLSTEGFGAETVMAIFGAVSFAGLHYLLIGDVIPDDVAPRVTRLLMQGLNQEVG